MLSLICDSIVTGGVQMGQKNSVVDYLHLQEKQKTNITKPNDDVVNDLQQRLAFLEANLTKYQFKKREILFRIKKMCDLNEKVTVKTLKTELSLNAGNHIRNLMQQAARQFDLVFYAGSKGRESFLIRKKPDNRVFWVASEFLTEFETENNKGNILCISTIKNRFSLSNEETQRVVIELVKSNKFTINCTGQPKRLIERRLIYFK